MNILLSTHLLHFQLFNNSDSYWIIFIGPLNPASYRYRIAINIHVGNVKYFSLAYWSMKPTKVLAFQTCSVESFRSILRFYSCVHEYRIWHWCRDSEAPEVNEAGFSILRLWDLYGSQNNLVQNPDIFHSATYTGHTEPPLDTVYH